MEGEGGETPGASMCRERRMGWVQGRQLSAIQPGRVCEWVWEEEGEDGVRGVRGGGG